MIEWLPVNGLSGLPAPRGADAPVWVLLADLRDPHVRPLLQLVPRASDLADERRPGASDRGWFSARRALTRSLAGLYGDCPAAEVVIAYDAPGAPRVKNPANLFVSVSGRGSFAAIAVARAPVGVDLEALAADAGIVEDFLHPQERAFFDAISARERAAYFMHVWTAKEALLKALGTGLTQDPSLFAIEFDGSRIQSVRAPDPATERRFAAGAFASADCEGRSFLSACIVLRAD